MIQTTPARLLTATIGLPGSGKTTWALKEVDTDPTTICRANRDSLRIAHAGRRLGLPRQEAVVTSAQIAMIRSAFENGYLHVIVDDTNLHGVGRFRRLADDLGAAFKVKDFRTVTLETCLQRNRTRQGEARLDDEVIRQMHDERVLPWLRETARKEMRRTA